MGQTDFRKDNHLPHESGSSQLSIPPPQPSGAYNISSNVHTLLQPPGTYSTFPQHNSSSQVAVTQFSRCGDKSVVETYLLAISPFGVLGAHHLYLQRYYWAVLYVFTLGLLGCGYIIDWFRIPCLVKQANAQRHSLGHVHRNRKTVSDAYTLWFPFGLLGFHHYYLENYAWGVVYTCTGGIFGIGWIVDAFRIPYLVKEANERKSSSEEKSACAAVALGFSPFGVFGAHHYYLDRPVWGIVYTFTLGLAGVGWFFDWFRMPALIIRANKNIRGQRNPNTRTVDDAYILWLTFGLLGFHHFYLNRPVWGTVYVFTLGICGLGWLLDMCRIPFLVTDFNKRLDAERKFPALAPCVHATVAPPYSTQEHLGTGTVNPAAYISTQPALYPPLGLFFCQQEATNAMASLHHGPPVYGTEEPPAYNTDVPPPYQPTAPPTSNEQAQELPTKENV